jgi:FeS assembly SUF system protein
MGIKMSDPSLLEQNCIEALRKVYDPELPLSIYDLGLIYEINVEGESVNVLMTLTNPACPVAGTLPREVEEALMQVEGVTLANVTLTWTPPWSKENLSPEHQLLFSTFM